MNNRLVILGTNEYQNPLIIRAKELGYETHVFGWKTGAIGETTADVYHDVISKEKRIKKWTKLF